MKREGVFDWKAKGEGSVAVRLATQIKDAIEAQYGITDRLGIANLMIKCVSGRLYGGGIEITWGRNDKGDVVWEVKD